MAEYPQGRTRSRVLANVLLLALSWCLTIIALFVQLGTSSFAGVLLKSREDATATIGVFMVGASAVAFAVPVLSVPMLGRRFGFVAGALFGIVGAALQVRAMQTDSFGLLVTGALFQGVGFGVAQGFRFAVAAFSGPAFLPVATAMVVGGGLLAAMVGPEMVLEGPDLICRDWLAAEGAEAVGTGTNPFDGQPLTCETSTVQGDACRYYERDGLCQDGYYGSHADSCDYGSDCSDCGLRTQRCSTVYAGSYMLLVVNWAVMLLLQFAIDYDPPVGGASSTAVRVFGCLLPWRWSLPHKPKATAKQSLRSMEAAPNDDGADESGGGEDNPAPLRKRPLSVVCRQPAFLVSVVQAAISFSTMAALMGGSSGAMRGLYDVDFERATRVIQMHFVAMYLPSLFTGQLVRAVSGPVMMLIGFVLLVTGNVVMLFAEERPFEIFSVGLVIVGVGWNFVYVAASFDVGSALRPPERMSAQGLMDTAILATIAAAILSPSYLIEAVGWRDFAFVHLALNCLGLVIAVWWCWVRLWRQEV